MAQRSFQKLEHSQKQILAPILQQNIQILLLNTVDLFQEINLRLDENPFLELDSENSNSLDLEEFMDYREKEAKEQEEIDDEFDNFEKNIYEDSYHLPYQKSSSSVSLEDSKQNFLENTITTRETLYSYLKSQMKMLELSDENERIADVIISCVDEYGILRTPIIEIAQFLNVKEEEIERVLEKIQEMDPPGIGARDSKEYILLQIESIFKSDPLVYEVAKEYFNIFEELEDINIKKKINQENTNLGKKQLQDIRYHARKLRRKVIKKISEKLGIKMDEIENILQKIEENITPNPNIDMQLDPEITYVVPDIIVSVNPDNYSIDVKVFDDYLPKIKLNQEYKGILKKQRGQKIAPNIQELRNKYEEAKSFVKLIQRRNKTIYNLTQHLVEIQREFFIKGPEYIKPLTIKEMSEVLEVHESTVSRIVNNKYIATPFGVYPIKYLFSHQVGGNQSDVSAKKVGELIKKIIEKEGGNKKLSDSKIEKILNNMGINISRRTVAKYRKNLDIKSSFER